MRLGELVCGELSDLLEKVRTGERLGRRDFLRLWKAQDLTGLGAVANFARERVSGSRTVYRYQAHVDCTGRPSAFGPDCDSRRQPAESASAVHFFGPAASGSKSPAGEIHVTGGLTAGCGVEELYTLVQRIRTLNPQLHLRAFSWGELRTAGERDEREPAAVLSALVEAGIDSLAGGALDDAESKGPGDGLTAIQNMERYVPWIRAAAELGLKSDLAWITADEDSPEMLADFFLCVRELQDHWTVFEACIPLPFQPPPEGDQTPMPTGLNRLRAIAAARLFMDNIPRIQSPVAVVGESIALVAQWYGADDVGGIPFPDGSVGNERTIELIRTAGRDPNDLYAGA